VALAPLDRRCTAALDDAVARHAEVAFEFLERLVRAPSTVGHEQAALEVFAAQVEGLGLNVRRLPFPAGPVADVSAGVAPRLLDPGARYQVLATTQGTGPLRVLLNGHIDVVPAETPDLWTTPPFVPDRRDGRMYGRGTGDMKGGFALGVLALAALADVAPDLFGRARLGFLAVVEEECTGNGALLAARDGVLADEVVLLEPTDLGLLLGGVGVLWVDLEVRGAPAHAESAHRVVNPVDLGMRLVDGVRAWAAGLAQQFPDPALTDVESPYNVNLGAVSSGAWPSSVPPTATFRLRVGHPRAWTPSEAERRVRELVAALAAADPDVVREPLVRTTGLRAAGYHLDDAHPLVQTLADAHQDAHGHRPRSFSMGSTTDARTYLDFAVPAVCFGAVAHDIHGVDESVELASIVDGARTLARYLLLRFAGDEGPGT
jgi:acetylornithine deacetylase